MQQNVRKVVGIDVAKDTLAISVYDGKHHRLSEIPYRKASIHRELIEPFRGAEASIRFLCENTGVYHQRLVQQLQEAGMEVWVVNPYVIRKYSQMRLKRAKTDAVDARLIAEYGFFQRQEASYRPRKQESQFIDQTLKAIEDCNQQITRTGNQLHALEHQTTPSKEVLASYRRQLSFLKQERQRLRKSLLKWIKSTFPDDYALLQSIPGIGVMSIGVILGIYEGFTHFENAKQAAAFGGICPSPYQSGTSVQGSGHISKQGNRFVRKVFYMAALSASTFNPLIKEQYQRLTARGKSPKQALIAAANKLLKLAFAILKSKKPFDATFHQHRKKGVIMA